MGLGDMDFKAANLVLLTFKEVKCKYDCNE